MIDAASIVPRVRAITEAANGAGHAFAKLTAGSNGDWQRLPLVRLSDALTNEVDELLADTESGMISLDQLDRVGARLAMLRAAVVREGGRPGR